MKKLKLNITEEGNAINKELAQLIANALQFKQSDEKEQALLLEIRNGNEQAIEELVKTSSLMIYESIKNHPSNKYSILQQFQAAEKSLMKLALSELNATQREVYFRFQTFTIRQALLEMEM
jgi:hypothetical protein